MSDLIPQEHPAPASPPTNTAPVNMGESVNIPAPAIPREGAPMCAHLRVSYRTEDFKYDGPDVPNPDLSSPHVGLRHGATLTRGWWECDSGCGAKFWPLPGAPSDTLTAEEAAAALDINHPKRPAVFAKLRRIASGGEKQ